MLAVTKAAFGQGLSIESIRELMPPRKWIEAEGELSADQFRQMAEVTHDPQRYFCGNDSDLFRAAGRTYALSNQWGTDTIDVVNQLLGKMRPGTVTYNNKKLQ